jgi:hypothetical protein
VSGVTSGFPCDGSSFNFVDAVGLLLVEGNGKFSTFEVLVRLEVHLEGKALILSVESVLNVG